MHLIIIALLSKVFDLIKAWGPAIIESFSKKKAAPPPPVVAQQPPQVVVTTPDVMAPVFTAPTCSIVIPPRLGTYSGSEFGTSILHMPPNQSREDAIYSQYQEGNVPDFMRNPVMITVNSNGHQLIYWVLPEVLCVGTSSDYLRTPLNPITAMKVGALFNCVLPTRKMAMQIWAGANTKLTPIPNGPP